MFKRILAFWMWAQNFMILASVKVSSEDFLREIDEEEERVVEGIKAVRVVDEQSLAECFNGVLHNEEEFSALLRSKEAGLMGFGELLSSTLVKDLGSVSCDLSGVTLPWEGGVTGSFSLKGSVSNCWKCFNYNAVRNKSIKEIIEDIVVVGVVKDRMLESVSLGLLEDFFCALSSKENDMAALTPGRRDDVLRSVGYEDLEFEKEKYYAVGVIPVMVSRENLVRFHVEGHPVVLKSGFFGENFSKYGDVVVGYKWDQKGSGKVLSVDFKLGAVVNRLVCGNDSKKRALENECRKAISARKVRLLEMDMERLEKKLDILEGEISLLKGRPLGYEELVRYFSLEKERLVLMKEYARCVLTAKEINGELSWYIYKELIRS